MAGDGGSWLVATTPIAIGGRTVIGGPAGPKKDVEDNDGEQGND